MLKYKIDMKNRKKLQHAVYFDAIEMSDLH